IVDGNRELDPWSTLEKLLASGQFKYFGMTVMPGPQLKQAIPFVKKVRELFPDVINIWGGYFASNQYKSVMHSGWVDYAINGPGDKAFPDLLDAIEAETPLAIIRNLIYLEKGEIVKTTSESLLDLDKLNDLPYDKLHTFYSMEGYLPKTWLGKRTIAYHSSFGCPFTCSFCAVVPIYNARWRGKSAKGIYADIMHMKEKYGADAIEFHDNNFFVARKRTMAFAELMRNEGMDWWGEGRIDTMDKYTDADLALLRESGCRIIFFGAETGNDEILAQMDKGGTQTAAQIKAFAGRLRRFDIVPEYSFVLGMPADTAEQVMAQIDSDIAFIKEIKEVNPATEVIIYVYSPVPTEGTELFEQVKASGFSFPENLEDWLDPAWEKFDMRKSPLTPWLLPAMVDKIRNFETVLNARFPTASDIKISRFQRWVMRTMAGPRYRLGMYRFPYELKALQKFWLRYRQPEVEGF
ncbi:MAG TPA: B12-binding domain-containing radical SAM protein, partial [Bacteroidetes bacterium]|nr:B12-binding domain-containing radical SAM protein [Bacteroidota bacterium]